MLRNTLFASVACVGLFLAAAPSHAETYSGGFHCTGNGYIGNCLNGMFQMLQTSGASLKCSWYDWSNYGGAWSDFEYTIEGTAEQIQRAKDVVTGWATSPDHGPANSHCK